MTIRSNRNEQPTTVVNAGDGRIIYVSPTTGPVNPDGSHASLEGIELPQEEPAAAPEPAPEPAPKRSSRTSSK